MVDAEEPDSGMTTFGNFSIATDRPPNCNIYLKSRGICALNIEDLNRQVGNETIGSDIKLNDITIESLQTVSYIIDQSF